jgi:hypothetical protein
MSFGFDAVRVIEGDDVEQIYNAIMSDRSPTGRGQSSSIPSRERGIRRCGEHRKQPFHEYQAGSTGDKWIAELNAELAAL